MCIMKVINLCSEKNCWKFHEITMYIDKRNKNLTFKCIFWYLFWFYIS